MTILYPAPAPVKPARPFGAGVLPPSALRPRSDRPFEPSPDDRAWYAADAARRAAERGRRNARRSLPPAWHFSRTDRLRALVERARGLETFLLRERCDAAGLPGLIAALDARLAALAGRIRGLCDAARDAARLDRHYDLLAAESAAVDALTAGLVPADFPPAPPRRPGNPMTDRDMARVGAVG